MKRFIFSFIFLVLVPFIGFCTNEFEELTSSQKIQKKNSFKKYSRDICTIKKNEKKKKTSRNNEIKFSPEDLEDILKKAHLPKKKEIISINPETDVITFKKN